VTAGRHGPARDREAAPRLRPVDGDEVPPLRDRDARWTGALPADIDGALDAARKRIRTEQKALYAEGTRSLLVVVQGRDASGKDGAIRGVFAGVNPLGLETHSFGVPSEEERAHDYLWRVHRVVPARGMIGIWNRSHYEDVIVPRVRDTIDDGEARRRLRQIADFERMLREQGTTIVKFLVHVSRAEQRQRLVDRLAEDDKQWKFRAGDLDDRARWSEFTRVYRTILAHTSEKAAPWYVVPADDKPTRDLLVAEVVAATLERMDARYPAATPEVLALRETIA
jgi:PPK2 family polyphosphate:nucleotide phosphotransferase